MTAGRRCLLFVIGIILLSLALYSSLPGSAPRSVQHGWQLGHVLLFAVWTWLLFPALQRICQRASLQILITVVLTLLLGLAIEYVQRAIGRDFSMRDVGLDLLGSLLALSGLAARGTLLLQRRGRGFLYVPVGLLSAWVLAPLPFLIIDELNMYRQFPVLAAFESPLETGRWRGRVERIRLLSGRGEQHVLRIPLTTAHYSGAGFAHFRRDWRGYRQLQVELFNPDRRPLSLTLRIHDDLHYTVGRGDYHDRFNRVLAIQPGWNNIIIDLDDVSSAPATRAMRLEHIEALGLFSVDLPREKEIYIRQLTLVP